MLSRASSVHPYGTVDHAMNSSARLFVFFHVLEQDARMEVALGRSKRASQLLVERAEPADEGMGNERRRRQKDGPIADMAQNSSRQPNRVQVLLGLLDERRQFRDRYADVGRPRLGLWIQAHDRPVRDFSGTPDLDARR
jgi:hypothetical protein